MVNIAVRELGLVPYMIRRFRASQPPPRSSYTRPVVPTPQPSVRPDAHATPHAPARPIVTVITSAYNIAPYIRESVLYALQQTYSNLEVIVIDDGSTDGIIDCVLKRPHRGQAPAMNVGVAEARGEYIALLDGDDVWLPQKLERHLAFHADHPDADMTYSGVEGDRCRGKCWRPAAGHEPTCHIS